MKEGKSTTGSMRLEMAEKQGGKGKKILWWIGVLAALYNDKRVGQGRKSGR